MTIAIRPATRDDATFLAWVMLTAARSHLARGIWDVVLDSEEARRLRYLERLALTQTRSWSHSSRFLVAAVNGEPAAALCGYDPHEAGAPALLPAMNEVADELGWGEAQRPALAQRLAPIATCVSAEAEVAWIIGNVATRPEFRRHGLVDALLWEILDRGRQKGHRLAQVSVLIGNTAAQRAYEKVGFRVADEKRHPAFEAAL